MGNSCISGRRRRRPERPVDEASRNSSLLFLSPLGDNRYLPYVINLYDQLEDINFLTDLLGEGSSRLSERESIRLTVRFVVRHYDRDENETLKKFALFQLHSYSEVERQFLIMIDILIEEVPIDHCLGACIINMILDGGCLPTKELISELLTQLKFGQWETLSSTKLKNSLCVVAAFAHKLAGALSWCLITPELLEFIHAHLAKLPTPPVQCESDWKPTKAYRDYMEEHKPALEVACAALLTLQAFLLTSDNRPQLVDKLTSGAHKTPLPVSLSRLETWLELAEYGPVRELATLSVLLLDNYFQPAGRVSAWDSADRSHLNALLNPEASTEAAHIMPDGLEVRSDASSFESVRATFPVVLPASGSNSGSSGGGGGGRWYYEATIVTEGIMQIGWAAGATTFLSHEGIGVGDDTMSLGLDGCRMCIWQGGRPSQVGYNWRRWQAGDVIGCLLDLDDSCARFSQNGKWSSEAHKSLFSIPRLNAIMELNSDVVIYPAASLMSNQQCRFNFGHRPFRYPPGGLATTMDAAGKIEGGRDGRRVLPWVAAMQARRERLLKQDFAGLCHICADRPATVRLRPCGHSGLCDRCPEMLTECPFCRAVFHGFEEVAAAFASGDDSETPDGELPASAPERGASAEGARK